MTGSPCATARVTSLMSSSMPRASQPRVRNRCSIRVPSPLPMSSTREPGSIISDMSWRASRMFLAKYWTGRLTLIASSPAVRSGDEQPHRGHQDHDHDHGPGGEVGEPLPEDLPVGNERLRGRVRHGRLLLNLGHLCHCLWE